MQEWQSDHGSPSWTNSACSARRRAGRSADGREERGERVERGSGRKVFRREEDLVAEAHTEGHDAEDARGLHWKTVHLADRNREGLIRRKPGEQCSGPRMETFLDRYDDTAFKHYDFSGDEQLV